MRAPAELATLEACRARLDELDRKLVELLNERARVSLRVGELKAADGSRVYAPEREAQVLRNVEAAGAGPLPAQALRDIWTEILSSSRALQRRLRIAFLGPVGSFGHEAAVRRFGHSVELVACATNPDVIHTIERGQADYGVVPVENSIDGGIDAALDTLVDARVSASAEIQLPIAHQLASESPLDQIVKVYSHPSALAQCRGWLGRHLPRAETVEVSSTSRAVQLGKEPGAAGIGSGVAAALYGVPILAESIQDQAGNLTRFLVVGGHVGPPTGRDKTGVVFAVHHRAGALHEALQVMARRGLNLTRIESRPSKQQAWEYVFFLDFQGHQDDPVVQGALTELREHAQFVRVLGSWPEETPAR
jgi:chorismate mutase/prephenate dehydratase